MRVLAVLVLLAAVAAAAPAPGAAPKADKEIVTVQWFGGCQLFSRYVDQALEAVSTDEYPWVEFSFYPCPGAPTPAQCVPDVPFKGVNVDCCKNDKFEACMVKELGCFPNNASCDFDLRLKMGKFLHCFEGGTISEGQCPASTINCTSVAGLESRYAAIQACYVNAEKAKAASDFMNATCTAENPQSWPHVRINGELTCEDDSCFIPLLPHLCRAYKSVPKPHSCRLLAAEEAFGVGPVLIGPGQEK